MIRSHPDQPPHYLSGSRNQAHPHSPSSDLTQQRPQRGTPSIISGRRPCKRRHYCHRGQWDDRLQPLPLVNEDVRGLNPSQDTVDGRAAAGPQVDRTPHCSPETVDHLNGRVLRLGELGALGHQICTAFGVEAALQVGEHPVPVHVLTSFTSADGAGTAPPPSPPRP